MNKKWVEMQVKYVGRMLTIVEAGRWAHGGSCYHFIYICML